MIVSRPISDAVRGVGRNALDLPVAAFAAVAVAFLAFAMPADLLTDLVGSSGLPSILSAAEPPLGFKARIGVGLIGAVLVFGLVFVLLRLLDRTGLDSKGREAAEPETPRARRRDFHPDAPAPRPISAVRDFGEPAPPVEPKPLWTKSTEAEADAAAFARAPEPFPQEPEPECIAFEPEPVAFEPEPQPLDDRWEPDIAAQPEPFEFHREAEPVAPQPEPEPFEFHREPMAIAPRPEPEPLDLEPEVAAIPEPEACPEPAPAPPVDGSASLDELMARLERGLARARTGQDTAPAAPAAPPQVFPEARDDRLQSAIDSLQRLTSRQS